MAMKLACSTAAFPDLSIEQVAEHAQQLGYPGLDVCVPGPSDARLASDPTAADVSQWSDVLSRHELAPVCLSPSVALSGGSARKADKTAAQIGRLMALAGEIGCPLIRVLIDPPGTGQTPRTLLQGLVGQVRELAERAADAGVVLVFENSSQLRQGRQWWHLLNEVDHPLAGMSWNAAAADEAPAVSVPVLSRRLRLARICDLAADGRVVPLGEGVVPVKSFVERLLGIGYDGYLIVDPSAAGGPGGPGGAQVDVEAYLSSAHQLIHGWLDEIAADRDKADAKAAKTAARNPPKRRAELLAK